MILRLKHIFVILKSRTSLLKSAWLAPGRTDANPRPDARACLPDGHSAAASLACCTRPHAPAARLRMLLLRERARMCLLHAPPRMLTIFEPEVDTRGPSLQ